jgi:hypothetical protein
MPWGHLPNGGRDKTVVLQDSEESQTDHMPQGDVPLRERPSGAVFPYRGQEPHGVDPGTPYVRGEDETDYDPDDFHGEVYAPEPIPVRVVTEDSHEIRAFRVYQTAVGSIATNTAANVPTIIAGQNERREVVRVKNLDAAKTVYLGHDQTLTPATGWPLLFGQELELKGETAVYGCSADGSVVIVAVYQAMAIAQN